jgi:hypothetical protein
MTFSIPKKATVNIYAACHCGLTVAAPIEIYEPTYVEALEAETAHLREALNKISNGGVGIGKLATPVERMVVMSEIAQDALEEK